MKSNLIELNHSLWSGSRKRKSFWNPTPLGPKGMTIGYITKHPQLTNWMTLRSLLIEALEDVTIDAKLLLNSTHC